MYGFGSATSVYLALRSYSPPHAADATAVWPGLRSGSTPRKNDSSAPVLTGPAAADLIRTIVRNRFDNQLHGAPAAIHCRRRRERSRAVFSSFANRGANSRSAAATPPSRRRARRRLTGQTPERRPVRSRVHRVDFSTDRPGVEPSSSTYRPTGSVRVGSARWDDASYGSIAGSGVRTPSRAIACDACGQTAAKPEPPTATGSRVGDEYERRSASRCSSVGLSTLIG